MDRRGFWQHGHRKSVSDGGTGELHAAQVFVAVLGASNYIYAQATWTQSLPDWISSHVWALAFLDGVPRQTHSISPGSSPWP